MRNLIFSHTEIFKKPIIYNLNIIRYYTNIILKELTQKDGGIEEKELHLVPIEYRYKSRSPESLKMLKDDWKKLSPTQVRKCTFLF